MDIKEFKNKPKKELERMLLEYREKLRDLRFKASNRQLKDVRSIRKIKKDIARILTLINKKENKKK